MGVRMGWASVFFCVLGQLMGKISKAIWKEEILSHHKKMIHTFLKNWYVYSQLSKSRSQFSNYGALFRTL